MLALNVLNLYIVTIFYDYRSIQFLQKVLQVPVPATQDSEATIQKVTDLHINVLF